MERNRRKNFEVGTEMLKMLLHFPPNAITVREPRRKEREQ